MADLAERIRAEADVASRAGQATRLYQIASEVEDLVAEHNRLVERARD